MGQNLCLPNFKGEQPGDIYCMSPLMVYLFGVVDNGRENGYNLMNAYLWREQDGGRGANNICSCLLNDFRNRGWMERLNCPHYGDLTIITDNCSGQNTNWHVVRLLMWLVEIGLFKRITLSFLVKGHTKNSCDRLFNLLKIDYHKRDVHTYNELHCIVHTNGFINAARMEPDEFYDFLAWQDLYYRTPKAGEFKRTHLFRMEGHSNGKEPTFMKKLDDMEAEVQEESLLTTKRNRECRYLEPPQRKAAIAKMLDELKVLKQPVLRPIKQ
eukprot:15325650-Ditylum_brightwellii.AAC.1